MSETIYNPSTRRFVKKNGSQGKKLKDISNVLLYCHGMVFDINPEILKLINLACYVIDKKQPLAIDSINIREDVSPSILSRDGNLPDEFSNVFNIVVDYNCDYTGWAVTPSQFTKYTTPLYENMVRALNPDAWCLITSFENTEMYKDRRMRTRVQDQIKIRLDLITQMLNSRFGNILMSQEHGIDRVYTMFYKSN